MIQKLMHFLKKLIAQKQAKMTPEEQKRRNEELAIALAQISGESKRLNKDVIGSKGIPKRDIDPMTIYKSAVNMPEQPAIDNTPSTPPVYTPIEDTTNALTPTSPSVTTGQAPASPPPPQQPIVIQQNLNNEQFEQLLNVINSLKIEVEQLKASLKKTEQYAEKIVRNNLQNKVKQVTIKFDENKNKE